MSEQLDFHSETVGTAGFDSDAKKTKEQQKREDKKNKEALAKRELLNDIATVYPKKRWQDLDEGQKAMVKAFGGKAPWDEMTEALQCSNDSYMDFLVWAGIMPPEYDTIEAPSLELFADAINNNPERKQEICALFGVQLTDERQEQMITEEQFLNKIEYVKELFTTKEAE